ncbi:MAG: hypothetical protein AAGF97_19235, partial [Planctomycetota bacterium]
MTCLQFRDFVENSMRKMAWILAIWSLTYGHVIAQVVAPPKRDGTLQKLARQVEPDLVGELSRLPQYVDFFQSRLANDPR